MTYIFDNDAAGQRFVEALADAHAARREVRVLIDDVGTRYTFPSIKWLLRRHKIPFDYVPADAAFPAGCTTRTFATTARSWSSMARSASPAA